MGSCNTLTIVNLFIDAIGPIVAIFGLSIAFSKWKLSRRQNREELLKRHLDDFYTDEIIHRINSEDSLLETWEDLGIEKDRHRQSAEKTLALISHLCYLRSNNLIEDGDFILFQDTADKVLATPCIFEFLVDEYKRVGEKDMKGRYHYLFDYLERTGRPMVLTERKVSPALRTTECTHEGNISKNEFTEPTMIIKISRAYREGMSDDDIREATQGWWRITPETANKAKLILAVANGMVKGVYGRSGLWQKDETGDHDGRYRFEGCAADDAVVRKFKDRSVADLFPKGASNPIRYFFPDQRS